MVKDVEQEEITEAVEVGKMHNITSKAGRLAMELAAEKSVSHKNLRNYKANTMILNL